MTPLVYLCSEQIQFCVARQLRTHPVLDLLLVGAHDVPFVVGSDNLVGGIVDAPDQVAERAACESRAIGQRAHVLADHRGGVLVVLELHPLGFCRQLDELVHQ